MNEWKRCFSEGDIKTHTSRTDNQKAESLGYQIKLKFDRYQIIAYSGFSNSALQVNT